MNNYKVAEFEINTLTIMNGSEPIGVSIPLVEVSQVAKVLEVHVNAIPIHMALNNLPVYSVGDKLFVDTEDLKILFEEIHVPLDIMRD